MNNNETKTEPWELESLSVTYLDEEWTIKAGGATMPEYVITEVSLETAIFELVKAVTKDAIRDEALEWSFVTPVAAEPIQHPETRFYGEKEDALCGACSSPLVGSERELCTGCADE